MRKISISMQKPSKRLSCSISDGAYGLARRKMHFQEDIVLHGKDLA